MLRLVQVCADGRIEVLVDGQFGYYGTPNMTSEGVSNAAKEAYAQAKKAANGDLDKVKSCIKITGFVNSTDDFFDQPKVINPASELLSAVFGDDGKHARAAVSTNSLPLGVAVEIDAILETV